MTRFVRLVCILAFAALMPSFAAAQTPNAGGAAAGADLGVYFPHGDLENSLTLDAFGEYYATPRVSIRGLLGWSSPGFQNRTEDHFRQARLLFNGVYNWERGVWHPYVTAGAGAYFVRQKLDGGNDPDGETRGGINFGGGIEYFTGRENTVKVEARWDVVSHPPALPDATGFTLTIGYKHYF
jgi:hypothetical protein